MTPQIAAYLKHTGVIPGITASTDIYAIKMNTTTFQGGSLVSLLFLDGSDSPAYVLRTPRNRGRPERLLANYRALQKMESVKQVEGTVPKPVFQGEDDGMVLTVETCMHGTSFFAALSGEHNDDLLAARVEAVFDWLWTLHMALPSDIPAGFVSDTLTDLDFVLQDSVLTDRSSAFLEESVKRALDGGMVGAFCQGDYNANNVLVGDDGRVSGVVDWEYSGYAPALFDFFSMFRAVVLRPTTDSLPLGQRIEDALEGRGPVAEAISKALSRYAPGDNRIPLLLVYVVRMLAGFVRATGNRRDSQLRPWLEYLNSLPPTPRIPSRARRSMAGVM